VPVLRTQVHRLVSEGLRDPRDALFRVHERYWNGENYCFSVDRLITDNVKVIHA
jgi:hypothetical protein